MTNFKKYLTEFGHEVDVLTRHYSEKEIHSSNLMQGMNAGDDFEGDYYKKNDIVYTKYKTTNEKLKFSNKLPKGVKGAYNVTQLDVFHYSFVEFGMKAYEQEFSENAHDLIITSSPPTVCLLLAKAISEKYGISWIADFRDSYFQNSKNRILDAFKKKALNKTLTNSSGILFVSDGMRNQNLGNYTAKNKEIPNEIIYNGFEYDDVNIDEEVIQKMDEIQSNFETVLLYTGSLYKHANLTFYLETIDTFKLPSIVLVCVGIQDSFKADMQAAFPQLNLVFIPKVSYSTSIKLQKMCDYLLLTVWRDNYTGFHGKIFEYLYSESRLIIGYDPPFDLKDYLADFDNVYYCSGSGEKFKAILDADNKSIPLTADQKESLSRKSQVKKLDTFLKIALSKK